MFKIIFTMTCTFFAIAAFRLGFEWQTVGRGMYPMLAYPIGTILMLIPFALELLIKRDW
jgi:hypothetical protein